MDAAALRIRNRRGNDNKQPRNQIWETNLEKRILDELSVEDVARVLDPTSAHLLKNPNELGYYVVRWQDGLSSLVSAP